jgi:hypothetical protein
MEIQDKQTHKAVRNDSVFSFVNNVMQDWPVAVCVIIDWQCVFQICNFFSMHFKKQTNIPENACPKKCPILHAEL